MAEKASQSKKIVLVVNGYGCHLDTPLGRVYLPKVAEYIHRNYRDILLVIFTGGFTQKKSAPGYSEATLMMNHVFELLNWWRNTTFNTLEILGIRPKVIAETRALTSFGNSQKSAVIIRASDFKPQDIRIVHFCEATRAANVLMLDRHFMRDLVEDPAADIIVETASWERADPFKQASNLVYNKLAIRFPWLGLAERETKKRIKRSREI